VLAVETSYVAALLNVAIWWGNNEMLRDIVLV